jgi:hypothetical protein
MTNAINTEDIERALEEITPDITAEQRADLQKRVCRISRIGEEGCTPEKIEEALNAAGAYTLAFRLMKVLTAKE